MRMLYNKLRRLIFKLIKALLLIIFLAIVAGFKYYEMRYFKPHIPYIEKFYHQAKKEETFTEEVRNIIFCLETSSDNELKNSSYFSSVIARHFVYELIEYQKISEWHLHNFLWSRLLTYYFDEEKIFILYLHLIPFEHGFGLANSAQYYFQKKISQLTVEEVVMLLGIARSPKTFSPYYRPENAQQIQAILMQQLKESNCLH